MTGQELSTILDKSLIIGDGAMGTYLYSKGVGPDLPFEYVNITNPECVKGIHHEYLDAGARLIETNTFAANRVNFEKYGLGAKVRDVCLAGARIARAAVRDYPESGDEQKPPLIIAGSVGPVRVDPGESGARELLVSTFTEQIAALIEGGVDLVILESFSDLEQLAIALEVTRSLADIATICQMTFDDVASLGDPEAMVARLRKLGADVIGANCGHGPLGIVRIAEKLAVTSAPKLSAFPNASFPELVGGRYVYTSNPEYFAEQALHLARLGINIIGGCCGTTPQHIRCVSERLRGFVSVTRSPRALSQKPGDIRETTPQKTPTHPVIAFTRAPEVREAQKGISPARKAVPAPDGLPNFLAKVGRAKVVTVELDPPKGASVKKFLQAAWALKEAGIDAVNVAENPLAIARMQSLVAGYLIQREVGLPAIVHLTCRDRNLIGQKSLILGAGALGVSSLLAVTGDPAPRHSGSARISSVYDTGSFGLIELIRDSGIEFNIGVAFNANARNLNSEVARLRRKVELGATFVETQPVFSLDRLHEVHEATKGFGIPVFVGILPLVSVRNAEFLANEFPGISIPDDIIARLRSVPEDNALSEGIRIAKELITEALPLFAGIYIIPPFNRADIAIELIAHIREEE